MEILNAIMKVLLAVVKYGVRFAVMFWLIAIIDFNIAVIIYRILGAFAILYLTMYFVTKVEKHTERGAEDGRTEESEH